MAIAKIITKKSGEKLLHFSFLFGVTKTIDQQKKIVFFDSNLPLKKDENETPEFQEINLWKTPIAAFARNWIKENSGALACASVDYDVDNNLLKSVWIFDKEGQLVTACRNGLPPSWDLKIASPTKSFLQQLKSWNIKLKNGEALSSEEFESLKNRWSKLKQFAELELEIVSMRGSLA